MKCVKCQHELAPTAPFCGDCGTRRIPKNCCGQTVHTKYCGQCGKFMDGPIEQQKSMDSEEDGGGLASVHAITTRFKENTTAHGIPHVHNAQGTIKTIFWIIISLTATAGFGWNATVLVQEYIAYNTTTSVSILSETSVTLPAITFCNTNAIRSSKLNTNTELKAILSSFQPGRKKRDTQAVSHRRKKRDNTASFGTKTSPDGRSLDSQFEFQERIRDVVADMSVAEKVQMGHQLDDLIIQCKYNGYTCNITADFYQYYDPNFGNCYTYNWGRNGEALTVSHRPGETHGLSLVFNVYQDEYVGFLTEAAGMRVMIHDQNVMPFPVDDGISASPGQQTSIGMRKVTLARMGKPYGDCKSTLTSDYNVNVYEEIFNVRYTVKACQVTCYQKSLISACRCGDPNYPLVGQAFGGATAPACQSSNTTQDDCLDGIQDKWNNDQLNCYCPNPCNEDVFEQKVSVAMWPSDHYKMSLFGQLPHTPLLGSLAQSNDTDEYKRNLGKINVYFQEFNYELIQEEAAYELFSLISDMGGILGLYIGFSMMTILEFFELAVDLLVVAGVVYCNKKQKKSSQTPIFSLISDMGGILGLYIGFSLMTILEFFELLADLLFICITASCCRRKKTEPQMIFVQATPRKTTWD